MFYAATVNCATQSCINAILVSLNCPYLFCLLTITLSIFSISGDTNVQLNRYLLRTVCSDLFNLLLAYFAEENGVTLPLTLTAQV